MKRILVFVLVSIILGMFLPAWTIAQEASCDGLPVTQGCTVNGVPDQPCLGTSGDDNINGTIDDDVIAGLGGNDTIYGGEELDPYGKDDRYLDLENDTICGDEGNDKIYGLLGDDDLFGGPGVDIVEGGPGGDILNGGTDDDLCNIGPRDRILPGARQDTAIDCEVVY